MRKIQVLGLALFAVFAVSAAVASAAFAGEWLEDNNPIPAGEELPVDTEGTLTLVNLTGAGGAVLVELECSGLFEGTVLAGGLGLILDLYSLGGETIGSLGDANTLALACLVISTQAGLGDCLISDLVEVWPLNLTLELGAPKWETKIELMAAGTEEFLLDLPAYSGYEVRCETGFLGFQENRCEGL